VFGEETKYEQLSDLDVDVCSDLMVRHDTNAVSQIHVDYIQRPSHRSGLITFEKGWVKYDFSKLELFGQVEGLEASVIWSNQDYDANQPYVDQFHEFIRYVEEGRMSHQFDVESALDSLKVVESFFSSTELGKKVCIKSHAQTPF